MLAAAAEARAASCAAGPFGAGSWPPGCWRPYADSSPFNRPIPQGAPTVPNSAAIVDRIRGDLSQRDRPANLMANVRGNAGEPTYYSTAADPVFTLRCGPPNWPCPLDGRQIRVPAGAVPEGGPDPPPGDDAHMTIVDQAGGYEYDLWQVTTPTPLPDTGGELRFTWGGRTALDGDGIAVPETPAGHATASHFGNLAGRVRAEELADGRIDHALFVVIDCDNGTFVYPARGLGQSCEEAGLPDGNGNAPPMGSHLQLDMTSAEIDALPIRAWKKTILRAMATYGMFFGDTGTDSYFAIETEAGSQYQSLGSPDRWWQFASDNDWEPFDPTLDQPESGDEDLVGKLYANPHDGDSVDWDRDVWSRLRVLDPCVARGDCPGGPTDPPTDPGPGPTEPGPGTTDPGPGTTDPGPGTTGPGTTDPGPATSGPSAGAWTDTQPPHTWIEGGPSGVTRNRNPSFLLRSTEFPATFECALTRDGAPLAGWTACTSPHALTSLADGGYTLRVRARDAAGNADPTPAVRAFRVDGRAPRCVLAARSQRLADVVRRGITLRARCDEAATLHLRLMVTLGGVRGVITMTAGRASVALRRPGSRRVTVRVSSKARRPLVRVGAARVTAYLVATDGAGGRARTRHRFRVG